MFTFGSDPEFMIKNGDKYLSAIPIVKASALERIEKKGHQFYYDNVLAECAIKPGATKEEAISNFRECFQEYAKLVKPHKLIPQASKVYDDTELKHPHARKVGCSPDVCCYELALQEPPKAEIKCGNLRVAGGHVHVGVTFPESDHQQWFKPLSIILMDFFVGIPAILMDNDPSSKVRRTIYGQAGRFRDKDYGFEYRSLSNFWLASPKIVDIIYDLCGVVVKIVQNNDFDQVCKFDTKLLESGSYNHVGDVFQCQIYSKDLIKQVINQGNKEEAKNLFKLASKFLDKDLISRIKSVSKISSSDFYKEWQI